MLFSLPAAVSVVALVHQASAHIQMVDPPPRQSQYNKFAKNIDYNIMAPITSFPCNGAEKSQAVKTLTAGQTTTVKLQGTATHGGGHCQFSISYNDKDFVAIETIMDNCLTGTGLSIDVKIPDNTPSCDDCTFAWSWVNAIGNREYYMDCADVKIDGKGSSLTGKKLTVVDLPGYPTIPEFATDSEHGKHFYDEAPSITISPSGGSAGSSSSSNLVGSSNSSSSAGSPSNNGTGSSDSPKSISKTNASEPTPVAVRNKPESATATASKASPAISLIPTPGEKNSSSVSNSACKNGKSSCDGKKKYKVCANDIEYTMPCPGGTSCSEVNSQASCV